MARVHLWVVGSVVLFSCSVWAAESPATFAAKIKLAVNQGFGANGGILSEKKTRIRVERIYRTVVGSLAAGFVQRMGNWKSIRAAEQEILFSSCGAGDKSSTRSAAVKTHEAVRGGLANCILADGWTSSTAKAIATNMMQKPGGMFTRGKNATQVTGAARVWNVSAVVQSSWRAMGWGDPMIKGSGWGYSIPTGGQGNQGDQANHGKALKQDPSHAGAFFLLKETGKKADPAEVNRLYQ